MKHLYYLALLIFSLSASAQYSIEPPEGYSHDIGNMISMLDNLKERVEQNVVTLDVAGTDFLLDDNANSAGAIIYHLAATEAYYQVYTLEKRQFNKEEQALWNTALTLGDEAREAYKGKPISFYIAIFDEVRSKTKELLKEQDDKWFAKKNGVMTNHWAWFHVMEHQANHMGQLALITKRIAKD